jgi:hypothetical protein
VVTFLDLKRAFETIDKEDIVEKSGTIWNKRYCLEVFFEIILMAGNSTLNMMVFVRGLHTMN